MSLVIYDIVMGHYLQSGLFHFLDRTVRELSKS